MMYATEHPQFRSFDGKAFELYSTHKRLADAEKVADRLRNAPIGSSKVVKIAKRRGNNAVYARSL